MKLTDSLDGIAWELRGIAEFLRKASRDEEIMSIADSLYCEATRLERYIALSSGANVVNIEEFMT